MAQGMGRHSMREVEDIGIRLYRPRSPILRATSPTSRAMPRMPSMPPCFLVWTPAETLIGGRLRQHIQSKHPLVAYCQRMTQYFKRLRVTRQRGFK